MFVWQHFDVVIGDECSFGSVSMLFLLMSARLAAFLSGFFSYECSSGSVSVLGLLLGARLVLFPCCYC